MKTLCFSFFHAIFGPLYSSFGPFLTLLMQKNIIFSPKENSAQKEGFLGPKTLFFTLFHTFLALFSILYGPFGPFLTLFNTKTSFLDLLGKQISRKSLADFPLRGGAVVPPLSLRIFWQNDCLLRYPPPLNRQNRPSSF